MKIKCEFTLNQAIKFGARLNMIDTLKEYLKANKIIFNEDTKINVLTLLKSNSISDVFWIFRCFSNQEFKVVIEVVKRAAARTSLYTTRAIKKAGYRATRKFKNVDYDTAWKFKNAAAHYSHYAAYYAEMALIIFNNRIDEREKQKKDFIELLGE